MTKIKRKNNDLQKATRLCHEN